MDKLNAAAGLKTPDAEVALAVQKAKAEIPRYIKGLFPMAIPTLCQQLEQSLQPGEEVRFMSGCKGGAFAVTDRRIVYSSSMGMEKRSLPIDHTLSAYVDRDLTETNLRFTADGGREMKLGGVVLSGGQESRLRDALPPGVMF
jgi:hypothetical protein